MIYGNMVGGTGSFKTCVLEDNNGNHVTGVVVDKEVLFTATDNDVREGFVYASNDGVSTGTKDIPAYHTTEGSTYVEVGGDFSILLPTDNRHEYTKLQVIICLYNKSMSESVSAEKVCINDKVYATGSTVVLSTVTVDSDNKMVNLGITNNGDTPCVMRYFTYKEEY